MLPDATAIASLLERAGIAGVELSDEGGPGLVVRVDRARCADVIRTLKVSDHAFVFMVDLFGIDTGEHVDVVYHLRSLARDEEIFVRVAHEYGSDLASVWEIHPAALMPERETAEMFGLTLSGHPNPKHLLLTGGSDPMLRKSVEIRTAEEVRNR